MSRHALVITLALLGAGLAGCSTAHKEEADRLEKDENVPNCRLEARLIEEDALKLLRDANSRHDRVKRRELMNRSMDRLRDARRLFEDELVTDPGSEDKKFGLRTEINRLSDEIERISKVRPVG